MADTSSQVRILREQLQQAESRAARERQRAEQEYQRAEEKEEQIRRTTFEELLESCHLLPMLFRSDRQVLKYARIYDQSKRQKLPNNTTALVGISQRAAKSIRRSLQHPPSPK